MAYNSDFPLFDVLLNSLDAIGQKVTAAVSYSITAISDKMSGNNAVALGASNNDMAPTGDFIRSTNSQQISPALSLGEDISRSTMRVVEALPQQAISVAQSIGGFLKGAAEDVTKNNSLSKLGIDTGPREPALAQASVGDTGGLAAPNVGAQAQARGQGAAMARGGSSNT